jgi:hypothetical protein
MVSENVKKHSDKARDNTQETNGGILYYTKLTFREI